MWNKRFLIKVLVVYGRFCKYSNFFPQKNQPITTLLVFATPSCCVTTAEGWAIWQQLLRMWFCFFTDGTLLKAKSRRTPGEDVTDLSGVGRGWTPGYKTPLVIHVFTSSYSGRTSLITSTMASFKILVSFWLSVAVC